MAIRNIRIFGDDVLRKKAKTVKEITPRVDELIDDMIDTMYEGDGVGLAAPQVGVLKRIAVIDIGEGPMVFINPEILESEGEQTDKEGCLSNPGKIGDVTRPNRVKVKSSDREMNEFELEAEGLLARALCHELDHLDGVLFIDRAVGEILEMSFEDMQDPEAEEQL